MASTTAKTQPPAGCVDRTLAQLTRTQRIGQLLMIGVPLGDPESVATELGRTPVGGVFLADRSTSSLSTVKAEIAQLQAGAKNRSGVALQIAVDQEGGYVQSLRGDDFPSIPAAVEQGEQSTEELSANTADWAARLVEAGVTLDLAPVADVVPAGTADGNPPIGQQDRQYGSTPEGVSESVVTVLKSMLDQKLGTTVKHFPGLGRVSANTDTSTDAVDDQTTADDPALQPFRDAIAAKTTAVMISSARYPQLDPDNIAAFSRPIITDLLRQQLKFNGLIISDDLGNAVAANSSPVGQRAVEFVRAGGDMVLTVDSGDATAMTAALTAAAAADPEFRAQVDTAARQVLRSKQSVGLLDCGPTG